MDVIQSVNTAHLRCQECWYRGGPVGLVSVPLRLHLSHLASQRADIWCVHSAAELESFLHSDRNRTEALNVKSSSQELVSHFLKVWFLLNFSDSDPRAFLLAASQMSLLFLRTACLLHAALLCLSFSPPRPPLPSYLSSSVLLLFIGNLLLCSRLTLSVLDSGFLT